MKDEWGNIVSNDEYDIYTTQTVGILQKMNGEILFKRMNTEIYL
jgi:hypothetical protein